MLRVVSLVFLLLLMCNAYDVSMSVSAVASIFSDKIPFWIKRDDKEENLFIVIKFIERKPYIG